MNIKNSLLLLAGGALLFLTSALSCNTVWLMATLMIAGIAGMAVGGAHFIRATWMRNDAERDKHQHWTSLDARLLS
ncbi:MAG: hypothetical protein IKZ92_00235 [Muribaculaceae bacterium]|nr:hypothetical protein [Muribaculaceae bacterium]